MKDQYKMKYFVLFTGWVIASVANSKSVAEKDKRHQRVMPTASKISNAEDCPVNHFKDDDGNCTECPLGSHGINCSGSCPKGFYGKYCLFTCSCTAGEECDTRHGCILIRTDEQIIKYTSLQNLLSTLWKNSTEYGFDKMADTSSQASVDGITTAVPGSDGTTTIFIREKRDLFRDIESFIIYTVSGVLLIIVINICCCMLLKRCEFKKGVGRSTARENKVEDVALQSISDANASDKQETMYANVYTEIIDVEGVYLEPCSGKGKVSRRSSAESKRIQELCYLDVVAVIEHENSPIDTRIKCPTFGPQRVPDCGYLDVLELDVSYTETDDDNEKEVKPNDDIQAGNINTGETLSDCYSAGI